MGGPRGCNGARVGAEWVSAAVLRTGYAVFLAGFEELSRTDDEVTLRAPDGSIVRRRYLHTPAVVAIVAVDRGDLLLVREFRAAVGEEVVQVPMGKIAPGRDPLSCARDELAEETGFQAGQCDPVGTLLACPGWLDQVVHVFHATELRPLPARIESDDPDDLEERYSSLIRLPVTAFGAAIKDGFVRDARTIAAVRLALG